ncbi:leucine-rich repeat-containing protein 14-like [Sarcophilus harrisii]|uniref:Leucine-rich repeat-containing protein 14 n=1 Tax=Sarcophilus harrisii TaxID=9305 RepID=A0A7N4P8E3_SARHA|nr:leucine-rich repeat-containing protein 14-like [Sarcophilus harrisii]XP_031803196.1 leucine-rich repeat-containing protein 14-like [Sarcophilus harrisii]
MYTLIFLSAQQLVKDEEATCKILESVPCIVYDVLFKVAYRENKTKVLCDLVKMWPYSRFKFQELLQTCWCSSRSLSRSPSRNCQECQEIIDYDESSINKIDAIILGVLNYIKKANTDDSQQLPRRILKQVDMTGLVSRDTCWNEELMRLWTTSISASQIYNSSQQQTDDPQSQRGDQMAEGFPVSTQETHVDLLIDLQMTASLWKFLRKILEDETNNHLHLKCRNFYSSYTFLRDYVKCFTLLNSLAICRMDLRYSKITLMKSKWLMSQMVILQNLQSLFLPSFSIDEKKTAPLAQKTDIQILAEKLGKLKHLREISIHCLCLSDLVEYLLRDLPYPLQSLQLSYCSLTEKDLTYMAQSHHSAHLIKLDLSCNRLTEQRDSFLKLLKSVSNSLKWLNITNCGLNDADFDEISSYLYSCTSLSHLGLHGNSLSKRSLIAFLEPSLCKLLNMKIISVPIFSDCYRNLRTSKQYDESSDFLSILNETKSTQLTREGLTITLTYNSLSDVGDYFDLR